mgnify:CR=1 FL=1
MEAQERRREAKGGQARPGTKTGPNQARATSLSGGPRVETSSQNRESDFLKMIVSPKRRAHFQREGQAKPSQKGLAKPGQAREASQGGEVSLGFWRPRFSPSP